MFVPGAMAATCAACAMITPADAANQGGVTAGLSPAEEARETQLIKAFSSGGLQFADALAPSPPPKPTGDPVADAAALARWDQEQAGAEPPTWRVRVDPFAKTPCPT